MSAHDPALVEKAIRAVIAHQRIPTYSDQGQLPAHRCCGCDHLRGESDGPNSPRVAEHQVRAVLDAVADDLRAEALEGAAAWLASARPLDESDPAHATFNAAIDEVRYFAEHDPWDEGGVA